MDHPRCITYELAGIRAMVMQSFLALILRNRASGVAKDGSRARWKKHPFETRLRRSSG